ncbi:hypothetical protein I551_2322 [Mycobacterium ulcerans str. Harvey]|uniref:Uncharacterized protein n=1 Tax=Mycobacterium ulcerans str. Harvey TaxID=1299332 RepID=A0ABN0R251_MYCUL|nr:hypothetical protein I551_2322 [Mycobacterium ulcerans str. Harvey]
MTLALMTDLKPTVSRLARANSLGGRHRRRMPRACEQPL